MVRTLISMHVPAELIVLVHVDMVLKMLESGVMVMTVVVSIDG